MQDALKRVGAAVCLEALDATAGVERLVTCGLSRSIRMEPELPRNRAT